MRAGTRTSLKPSRLAGVVAVLLLALLTVCGASAQTVLRVDGRDVGEVRTDLVPGHSYAPLDRLAGGLGARVAAPVGADRAALTFGGHVIVLDIVAQAEDPNRSGAVRLDGRGVGDLAAIRGDDAVWAPVAPLVRALGADVAYLTDRRAVVVVTPRPELTDATLGEQGEGETLRLTLDAPVTWTRFDDDEVGRTELLLRRARLERARTLSARLMSRVDLVPEADGVRVRIDAPGARVEVIALADGSATDLRIRARPAPSATTPDVPASGDAAPRIALDAGTGADQAALLDLAEAVAAELRSGGAHVVLTHDRPGPVPPERRLAAAAEAQLFVRLQSADLPAGEVRLWVLGEAGEEEALEMAVRRNAVDALRSQDTGEIRRELLLGLVPDLDVGRRAARAISTALFQLGGYRAGEVGEAPLAALAPAAGRGVLIEIGTGDLSGPQLPGVLAEALASAASGAR
jgi:N-acetylmuramoyl-L-alanine amidase